MTMVPNLQSKMRWNILKDFEPVSLVATVEWGLITNNQTSLGYFQGLTVDQCSPAVESFTTRLRAKSAVRHFAPVVRDGWCKRLFCHRLSRIWRWEQAWGQQSRRAAQPEKKVSG